MNFGSQPQSGTGGASPARLFTWICALFLLLQGASTLAARLVPAIDRAFPLLLAATRMMPRHSLLHIATALLAFGTLALGRRSSWWFAALFGSFYAGLGALGALGTLGAPGTPGGGGSSGPEALCGLTTGLGLQPFDHPFHLLLGLLGIVAAWRTPRATTNAGKRTGSAIPTSPMEEP